jgi:DNA-binding transcriptional ArsR family regulator
MRMKDHIDPSLDRVYGAIADPTRRAILSVLARGEANVGTLVHRFPISFNGVSKHIKVLERAGLVERTIQGREHRLRIQARPLRGAAHWIDGYREFWDARLDALEAVLVPNQTPGSTPKAAKARPKKANK